MAIPQPLVDWTKNQNTSVTNPNMMPGTTAYRPATLNDPTQWNVDDKQTVAGQLKTDLATGSPLMQQADTQGLQTANSRGLLNSSIAAGASEGSMIAAATPIATSDATTYSKAAGYNADQRNQFANTNFNALNTAAQFNAGNMFTNQQNRLGQSATAALQTQQIGATAQQNLLAQQATAKQNLLEQQATAKQNQQAQQATAKLQTQTLAATAAENLKAKAQETAQAQFKANAEASIAQINNKYKFDAGTQAIVGGLGSDLMKLTSAINADTNMNQQSKDYSIQQAYATYKANISLISAVGSIPNVANLLKP